MRLRQYSGRANSGHFQSTNVREKISNLRDGVLYPTTGLPSTTTPTDLPFLVRTPFCAVLASARSTSATGLSFKRHTYACTQAASVLLCGQPGQAGHGVLKHPAVVLVYGDLPARLVRRLEPLADAHGAIRIDGPRSEEHTSELQS